ncbi:MAG: hypothetical protein WCV00_19535 [Verrucomicrobiia bacterium]
MKEIPQRGGNFAEDTEAMLMTSRRSRSGYAVAGRNLAAVVLIVAVAMLICCSRPQLDARQSQATVDAVAKVLHRHGSLLEASRQLPRMPGTDRTLALRQLADAKDILALLPRLEMEPGYALDYVYQRDELGGRPILYSRAIQVAPFASYAAMTNSMSGVEWNRRCWESWGSQFYSERLRCDGSTEGFFQFIVLHLMGDQFFHLWHDAYHDEIIICEKSGIDALLQDVGNPGGIGVGDRMTQGTRLAAYALDLMPRVVVKVKTVEVSVVIFTKWDGFERRSYNISRAFPHRLLGETRTKLVDFSIGYVM